MSEVKLKYYKLSARAQQIIDDGIENRLSADQISIEVYRETREKISGNAIINYRQRVRDKTENNLTFLRNLQNLLHSYAPKETAADDFGWLQGLLNAMLKNRTADLLLNEKIDPKEMLKYWDAAERRAIERMKIELEQEKLKVDIKRVEVLYHEAKAKADIANAKLLQIQKLARDKKKPITGKELNEIIERTYDIPVAKN